VIVVMDDNHDTLIGLHNILGDDEINYVFSWMHNLSMKEGSFVLFCSYEIHRSGMLQIVFLVSWESS
jgi:hypothetical protein